MTNVPPIRDRRRMLRDLMIGSLTVPLLAATARAHTVRPPSALSASDLVLPDSATMLVAGPAGGMLDRWSRVLAPLLARALPLETGVRRTAVGAPDGVTGANQFGARVVPDGQTLLLAPGDAALAWLVGDPRAQYDVARWVPVLATLSSAVVFLRAGVRTAGRVRLASTGSAGVDLPATLGLAMLGGQVELLPVLPGEGRPGEVRLGENRPGDSRLESRLGAVAQGDLDAVLVRGHRVEDQARALVSAGARPLFAFGAPDPNGRLVRSPLFPDVPTFAELFALSQGRRPMGPLFEGWCAAATAAQMEFALVLPELTPAALVASWRRAGNETASTLDLQAVVRANDLRIVSGADMSAASALLAADQAALLSLRHWQADHANRRPA